MSRVAPDAGTTQAGRIAAADPALPPSFATFSKPPESSDIRCNG